MKGLVKQRKNLVKQTSLALAALFMLQILAPAQALAEEKKEFLPTVLHRTANVVVRIALDPIDAPIAAVALRGLSKNFTHKDSRWPAPLEIIGLTGLMLVVLPVDGAISADPLPTAIDVLSKHKPNSPWF